MKKILVLLLSVFVVMNVFASTGTLGSAVGDISEATLNLSLENEYKFAFVSAKADGSAPDVGTGSETALGIFTLQKAGDALTVSGEST